MPLYLIDQQPEPEPRALVGDARPLQFDPPPLREGHRPLNLSDALAIALDWINECQWRRHSAQPTESADGNATQSRFHGDGQ